MTTTPGRRVKAAAGGGLAGRLAGGAGLFLSRRHAPRRRRCPHGRKEQEQAFRDLTATLAPTVHGRRVGLEAGMSYRDFSARIPVKAYEGFAPDIERMKRGESDILHPGRCPAFAVSSGTTAGPSKWLPVNQALLAHFRQAGLDALGFHVLRSGRDTVFRGRHLFLGGSTTLQTLPNAGPPIHYGDLSGLTAMNLPPWVDRLLYEPGREIARMGDWPAKLDAIARRTRNRDIRLVAGIPSWLLVLAARMGRQCAEEDGLIPGSLKEIWPNLECVVHGGVPLGPFAEELRQACGPGVRFQEVYPASEGFIAAQDAEPEAGLRLLTRHSVFFEFLPLAEFDEARPNGQRAVPLAGVRPGTDYVLLLTTPAGLVRYIIGDIVRFTGTTPPRLVYAGRTRLQLSAFGEHVIEKELTDAVVAVGAEHRLAVADFHVAPLFPDAGAGRPVGRHEWWLELRSAPAVGADQLAPDLDRALALRNDDYAAKRAGGGMDAPLVHLVPPGFFEDWLRKAGKWGGQHKTPRCRSDRQIADQLAEAK
jgi:hypothetical protein